MLLQSPGQQELRREMMKHSTENFFVRFLLTLLFSVGLMGVAWAAQSDVNCTSGDDLQDAIDMAPTDSVLKIKGTCEHPGGFVVSGKNLTLQGDPSATFNGKDESRVLLVGSDAAVTMKDLAVIRGFAGNGAGIYNFGDLTLERVDVHHNLAACGGGVMSSGPNLTVKDSKIHHNFAYAFGGGIGVSIFNCDFNVVGFPESLIVDNSDIYQNDSGVWGGGIGTLVVDSVKITNSKLRNNTASDSGGGFSNYEVYIGGAQVENTVFTGNSAGVVGGGIDNGGSLLEITNSSISKNYAYYYGAGMQNDNGYLVADGCLFDSNTARVRGGAIGNFRSDAIINNSVITNNLAYDSDPNASIISQRGGGLWNSDSTMVLNNTLVAFNEARGLYGGGVYNQGYERDTYFESNDSIILGNRAFTDAGGLHNDNTTLEPTGTPAVAVLNDSLVTRNVADSDDNGSGIAGGVFDTDNGDHVTLNNTPVTENLRGTTGPVEDNCNFTDPLCNVTLP